MAIAIRKYTRSFIDLLELDLDLDFWGDVVEVLSSSLEPNWANPKLYFAYDRSRVVGFILGSNGCKCYYISVDYRYRNQGIASELVRVSGFYEPHDIYNSSEARGFWASVAQSMVAA